MIGIVAAQDRLSRLLREAPERSKLELQTAHEHHGDSRSHADARRVPLQPRTARKASRVYDVANIDNKDFSERIVSRRSRRSASARS